MAANHRRLANWKPSTLRVLRSRKLVALKVHPSVRTTPTAPANRLVLWVELTQSQLEWRRRERHPSKRVLGNRAHLKATRSQHPELPVALTSEALVAPGFAKADFADREALPLLEFAL